MSKQPPISVVNKPRRTTTRKKTTFSSPRKPQRKKTGTRKKKVAKKWSVPAWAYYVLMGLVTVAFLGAFFYFFIRPYSYRWKPCYGFKAYGECMPSGFHVHGIDVSHYQGTINWKMLTQTRQGKFPIHFVFMKASEGGDYGDRAFIANFDSAKAHGFIRGAYHFYNPKTDPIRQADFFINSVKLDSGDLPPVLDIEKRGDDEKTLRRDLKLWLDRIEQYYKVKPILYTSYKFKTRYLNDSIFDSYPYWIAHYYVDSVEYKGDWKFWQHTDVGILPGVSEKVDLNIFNGSLEEFQKMTIKK
ncbi:MAG: glycoside hydrolase family 25 protein [Bacteroides sp.]|nr:glycoside hydrolase family 25 protein [Bacteroides sp.]